MDLQHNEDYVAYFRFKTTKDITASILDYGVFCKVVREITKEERNAKWERVSKCFGITYLSLY